MIFDLLVNWRGRVADGNGAATRDSAATQVSPPARPLEARPLEARPLQTSAMTGVALAPPLAALEDRRRPPPWAWTATVYVASRLLLLVLATIVAGVEHTHVLSELTGYDGQWYLRLAEHGYPTHVEQQHSTLGFFPLYPLTIRAVAWLTSAPATAAALGVALSGGLVATLLVQRLATSWWGTSFGRRATVAFVLFPGSIVFSMAYSECLTIPLTLGCLLTLRSRRWALAGLLAGLATAVDPIAVVLIPVCVVAALRHIRTSGWRSAAAWRSLAAPALSPLGIGGFAAFLWYWTGSPFATLTAQRDGWHQQLDPFTALNQPLARHLIAHAGSIGSYLLSWNIWNGVAGAVFIAWSLVSLWRVRRELSTGALLYTAGVGLLTLWSVMTLPKARWVLVAVPAVVIWARRLSPRSFGVFLAAETAAFTFMSILTLSGHMLP